MRIIGEAPPVYGGKVARSQLDPQHKGECVLSFVHGDQTRHARFINYGVARTAATMAIFSDHKDIDRVVLMPTSDCVDNSCCKVYSSAKTWLSDVSQ